MTARPQDPAAGLPYLVRPTSRREALKTLGGLAGLVFAGQFVGACGSSSDPGSPAPEPVDPGDPLVLLVPGFVSRIDAAYAAYAESVVNAALRDAVRQVPVIGARLVPLLPDVDLAGLAGGAAAFDSLKAHYAAAGIDHVEIPASSGFNTQQAVTANAAAIAGYLAGLDKKRVTILTHSKGGLDTLHALLTHRDLWGTTVVGWVALQAPFHGSAVADNVPADLAGHLLSAFGGDQQALLDLRTTVRGPYMADRAATIAELTAAIPVLSCHSSFTTGPGLTYLEAAAELAAAVLDVGLLQDIAAIVAANLLDPARAAAQAAALIRARVQAVLPGFLADIPAYGLTNLAMAESNDGLVAISSTLLAGADSVALSPAGDHASPVKDAAPFRNFWTEAHRNEVTAGLVEQARGRAARIA